jgi:hypothetical protein
MHIVPVSFHKNSLCYDTGREAESRASNSTKNKMAKRIIQCPQVFSVQLSNDK